MIRIYLTIRLSISSGTWYAYNPEESGTQCHDFNCMEDSKGIHNASLQDWKSTHFYPRHLVSVSPRKTQHNTAKSSREQALYSHGEERASAVPIVCTGPSWPTALHTHCPCPFLHSPWEMQGNWSLCTLWCYSRSPHPGPTESEILKVRGLLRATEAYS